MKAIVILGLGLAGGAGAFGLLNWVRPAPVNTRPMETVQSAVPPREQSDTPGGTSAMQEQIRQLALEVAALRREDRAGAVAPPPTIQQESAPPKVIPNSEARARAQQEHEERIADVEAAFRSEDQDPRWSSPMEADIRDAVGNANLTQTGLQEVQCRSDTCRVELKVQDPVEFSRQVPNLISRLSEHLHGSAMDFVDDPRGGHTGVLYLFR